MASIGAKFTWIAAALLATGLSLHVAAGIAPLRAPWTGAIIVAAVVLAGALAVRIFVSAAELAGDWLAAGDMLGLIWSLQAASGIAVLAACVTIAIGALLRSRLALFFGAAGAALAFGLTGHARSEGMPAFLGVLVALHVLIAGFWAAAPLSLWPTRGLETRILAQRHERFGAIALTAVPALFVAGAVLALIIGRGLPGLAASAYGATIATKAALALTALGIGAWNRLRLAKLLNANAPAARTQLKWAMILDAALFLGIAAATSAATTVFAPAWV